MLHDDIRAGGFSMTVVVLCWIGVWATLGFYIAERKGFPKVQTMFDALLLGPFVLLLFLAKAIKKK